MFQALQHVSRFISIARILARHDALFALEYLKVAPGLVAVALAYGASGAVLIDWALPGQADKLPGSPFTASS